MSDQCCRKNCRCRAGITQAVDRRCLHCRGIKLFSDPVIVKIHIQLHQNRQHQNHNNQSGELCLLRMYDLAHRIPDQFICHQKNRCCHHQPRDILNPAMSERMLRIRLCACQLEARQRHDRRSRIRQVVDRICRDGNGMADGTRKKFSRKEQYIEQNTYHTAQHTIFFTNLRLIVLLLNEYLRQ